MKKILAIFITGLMMLSLGACNKDTTDSSSSSSQASDSDTESVSEDTSETTGAETTAATLETSTPLEQTIDREGNVINIPALVEKIVSTSPSNTEILVGLGLTAQIIAADTYSSDTGIDSGVANLDMVNLDIEKIASLEPDVVFVNGISVYNDQDPYSALKDLGIDVVYIPAATSVQDIMNDITFIGTYTGAHAAAIKMVADMQAELKDIVKKLQDSNVAEKSVYFEISSAPYCYTTGVKTYLNQMLEMCKLKNIFQEEGYLSVSEEQIVAANPDVVISNVNYEGYDFSEIFNRSGWKNLNALKFDKVFQISSNSTSRASQNILKGVQEIVIKVYPNLFEDPATTTKKK